MEELNFDLSGLLTDEEAANLLEDKPMGEQEKEEPAKETIDNVDPTEEEKPSETVGEEEIAEPENDAVKPKENGSSPKFYSSIANALKNDGIFPDFSDEEIDAVKTPGDFAELFEKAVTSRMDERIKRVDEALGNGVAPNQIQQFEETLQYLGSINDETLNAETEEGENLRKQLIYNDLLNKGYSKERASREVDKSFKSGSDLEDAKDALAELTKFYKGSYDKVLKDAKDKAEAQKQAQKETAEKFRKMVLDEEVSFGSSKLDKRTKQKVYDAVSKPVWKDPDTGQLLTQVQKFQKEKPLEFMKQLGMWFVLTDGGKDVGALMKEQLKSEKNKGIRELERKINSSAFDSDGSLRYISGEQIDNDTLLSDGWKVDLGNRNE